MFQDGQVTVQPTSRDSPEQLLPIRARSELHVEETCSQEQLAQPRIGLPGRLGRSWSRPGSCAYWEQREFAAATAAAGAQEAAGRSAEQIHQPDPGLAEQVRSRVKRVTCVERVSVGFVLLFGPVHVALLAPRHR